MMALYVAAPNHQPRAACWPGGRVAMQRTANPRTSVRFRPGPPFGHPPPLFSRPVSFPDLSRLHSLVQGRASFAIPRSSYDGARSPRVPLLGIPTSVDERIHIL